MTPWTIEPINWRPAHRPSRPPAAILSVLTAKDRPCSKERSSPITGASSGIGTATAVLLAERGASLVLARRRADRLQAVADHIATAGGTAGSTPAPTSSVATSLRAGSAGHPALRELDVLISNAGIAPISRLDELRVEDWDEMIDVNIKGVLYGIAAALPVFRRQGFGQFVNVLSTAGIKIVPTMAVYAATKNAVRTISEALRQEAGANLRVTTISPGFIDTDLASSMTDPALRAQTQARQQQIAIPPAAIARAIAFAIEQPADVDINEIVVRPTAQD